MLTPIWDEAADKAKTTLPEGKVAFAKVQCVQSLLLEYRPHKFLDPGASI